MAWVAADDNESSLAADDLALVAPLFDRGFDFHKKYFRVHSHESAQRHALTGFVPLPEKP